MRTHPQRGDQSRTRLARGEPAATEHDLSAQRPQLTALLALQRLVGNSTVCRLVQRFEGHEHKDLGDVTATTIDLGGGLVLSWGDVVALAGDHYGSVEELAAAVRTPGGKENLRAALEAGHIASTATASLPPPTQEQKDAENARYLALAAENVTHFAAEGKAVDTWRHHHTSALAEALTAGLRRDTAAWEAAKLREAFGQHFLTDAFSGGHVRTPRGEILQWYSTNFGPRVRDHLLTFVKSRVIDVLQSQAMQQIYMQAPQIAGNLVWNGIRDKVKTQVDASIDQAVADAGGPDVIGRYLGLVIGGAVSGAMHDLEGERGVWVNSQAHPEPWQAFGDAQLAKSPDSRAQAELAVLAAHEELEAAYLIGYQLYRRSTSTPPATVYFGFDSAQLSPDGQKAAAEAADYLKLHPDAAVNLTGHTDPVGSDAYNDGLGRRRAEAVQAAMTAAGAPSARIMVASSGKHALATKNPRQYALNRRVAFAWTTVDPGMSSDPARDEANARLAARTAPPYAMVTRYVPQPVEGRNPQLEEWRWGQIPPSFATRVDSWVKQKATPDVLDKLVKSPALHDEIHNGITVRPSVAVDSLVHQALANPTAFLSTAFGQPMSP